MFRTALAATILTASLLAGSPAFAGKTETAFLAKLVGKWSGGGTITGSESGKIDCTMTVRAVDAGVSFRSKCDAGSYGPQNFSATISYNDAEARYEAKSSSGEVTLGVKSGNSVVFTSKMKGIATGTSVMKLSAAKAIIDTVVVRPNTTTEIKSHVVLSK